MAELCFLPATELARLIRERRASAVEVLEAHLAQIERRNPTSLAERVPVTDSTVAARHAAAGAIVIGHTNVPPLLADFRPPTRCGRLWSTRRTVEEGPRWPRLT